jgi:hypothetical protein
VVPNSTGPERELYNKTTLVAERTCDMRLISCPPGVSSKSKEYRMKELRAVVSDDEFATLQPLAHDLEMSLEELMKRSRAAYMAQAEPALRDA